MDMTLIAAIVIAAAVALLLWSRQRKRHSQPTDTAMAEERLDTLIGWPPEATRILRTSERLAYSTLKLALPGYMILAQVPIARFINVAKRNSYGEWMRRVGSQCVDFVVCDVTSQVISVIEVRPPEGQMSDRLRRRLERLARTLTAVGIPIHVWNEEALPSVEAARAKILPHAPAVPARVASRRTAAADVASAEFAATDVQAPFAFADTDRHPSYDEGMDVIEMPEPSSSTWFDDLDSESSKLPLRSERPAH